MAKSAQPSLSRRERQIMDVVYQRGQATVAEVLEALHDPPSYSAVRALMRILEDKGHLRHHQDGPRYVFSPTVSRDRARRSVLSQVVRTFFDGSVEQTVAALIDMPRSRLSQDDLARLSQLIEKARKEGR
jgi:predicted transcriptional regulator